MISHVRVAGGSSTCRYWLVASTSKVCWPKRSVPSMPASCAVVYEIGDVHGVGSAPSSEQR